MNRLLARLGLAGFAFFLVKGLLWLIIPAAVLLLGCGQGPLGEFGP